MPTSTHTTHVRFYDNTLRLICDCPTGGQRRPPLQNVVRFRRRYLQFCDCILPGRARHRPLRTGCVVGVRCAILMVHRARAEQAPPLRYDAPRRKKGPPRRGGSFSYLFQHSFAPAGILSSTMMRFSFSSPCSVCTVDRSMPQDSSPIILRGGRFTIATSVLPTSASGS